MYCSTFMRWISWCIISIAKYGKGYPKFVTFRKLICRCDVLLLKGKGAGFFSVKITFKWSYWDIWQYFKYFNFATVLSVFISNFLLGFCSTFLWWYMIINLAFVFSAFVTTLLLLLPLSVMVGTLAVLLTFVLTLRVDISPNPFKAIDHVLLNISVNISVLWRY